MTQVFKISQRVSYDYHHEHRVGFIRNLKANKAFVHWEWGRDCLRSWVSLRFLKIIPEVKYERAFEFMDSAHDALTDYYPKFIPCMILFITPEDSEDQSYDNVRLFYQGIGHVLPGPAHVQMLRHVADAIEKGDKNIYRDPN